MLLSEWLDLDGSYTTMLGTSDVTDVDDVLSALRLQPQLNGECD
jgi:hypothetical protein